MSVIQFPNPNAPTASRKVEPLTLEEFCLADAMGAWTERIVVNGMTILLYAQASLICASDGSCSAISIRGTRIEDYFSESNAAIA